jgi:hypothetical protein
MIPGRTCSICCMYEQAPEDPKLGACRHALPKAVGDDGRSVQPLTQRDRWCSHYVRPWWRIVYGWGPRK